MVFKGSTMKHLLSRTGAWQTRRDGERRALPRGATGNTFSFTVVHKIPTSAQVMPTSIAVVAGCKNETKSKLPVPERASSKLKSTLKNFISNSTSSETEKTTIEPRMTRSSSLRRANSLKRFSRQNHNQASLIRSGTGGSLERCSRKTVKNPPRY